jgi:Carboxypeptidase regulatory-like domain
MAGPTCPVERIDSPCPDRPVRATITVKDASGAKVATVSSGADGRFEVGLPAGTYVLIGQAATGLHRVTGPVHVTVRPGRFTSVTIEFDTGIR